MTARSLVRAASVTRCHIAALVLICGAGVALAAPPDFRFNSIDGGTIALSDWLGSPVLVVNTASLCAYTPQYEGLQALHDTYAAQGLKVLAVPSDDFAQELGDAAAVKEYCDVNFALTLPMTDISPVTGAAALPFYKWVSDTTGFEPGWNFNKILLDGTGAVVATWGSNTSPQSDAIVSRIEALLP